MYTVLFTIFTDINFNIINTTYNNKLNKLEMGPPPIESTNIHEMYMYDFFFAANFWRN